MERPTTEQPHNELARNSGSRQTLINEISRNPAHTVTELTSAHQHQKTGRPSWSARWRAKGLAKPAPPKDIGGRKKIAQQPAIRVLEGLEPRFEVTPLEKVLLIGCARRWVATATSGTRGACVVSADQAPRRARSMRLRESGISNGVIKTASLLAFQRSYQRHSWHFSVTLGISWDGDARSHSATPRAVYGLQLWCRAAEQMPRARRQHTSRR